MWGLRSSFLSDDAPEQGARTRHVIVTNRESDLRLREDGLRVREFRAGAEVRLEARLGMLVVRARGRPRLLEGGQRALGRGEIEVGALHARPELLLELLDLGATGLLEGGARVLAGK